VLKSNLYADEVRKDGEEAQSIGATGVPFFVVNRKYAVSGAQNSDVFLQTLKKSFLEWRKENSKNTLEVIEKKSMHTEGRMQIVK
jgi:predicted DsbA family dithiol-disulfide isomerase